MGGFNYCGFTITGHFFLLRQFPAADKISTPAFKGEKQVKAESVGAPLWLQRPETSRGRRFPAPRSQLEEAEPPTHNPNSSAEDEARGRLQKQKREEKSSEREDSLTEAKEKRRIDQEVEKEKEHLVREKKKRMRLLEEELKREEEEEERRLREESEDRLRYGVAPVTLETNVADGL